MIYILFDGNDELLARTTSELAINELMYHFWIEGTPCYLVEMTPKEYEKYCKKYLTNVNSNGIIRYQKKGDYNNEIS